MTNRSRDKGTSWETQVVRFLQEHGWPLAERRARRGTRDAGDIAGVGVAWIKRPRKTSPGDAYVLMSGAQFVELLKAAGY